MRKDPSPQANDLFFDTVVEGYVTLNRRFVRREWLAANLDQKLAAAGARFVLIVAEPGAGKSAFMAQLAHDHPAWPRYFIRRDQHALLADVSVKSLLLRVGYQIAARYPDLFSADELKLSVAQHVGEAAAGSEVVGVDAERLVAFDSQRKTKTAEWPLPPSPEADVFWTRAASGSEQLHRSTPRWPLLGREP
jgi:hypothetical protein